MATFTYSTSSKRYHNKDTGQFVGRIQIRQELDSVIDISAARMKNWTESLIDGEVSLPWWQTEMMSEIKSIHTIFAVVANGGWDSMDDSDYERVSGIIENQFEYLQNFANEIYTGEQLPNGTMSARSTLYAESARVTYEAERFLLEKESGSTEEMNILGGSDHCGDCLEATLVGWVEIGSIIPIGSRQCGGRCRCTIIYRTGSKDRLGSQIA